MMEEIFRNDDNWQKTAKKCSIQTCHQLQWADHGFALQQTKNQNPHQQWIVQAQSTTTKPFFSLYYKRLYPRNTVTQKSYQTQKSYRSKNAVNKVQTIQFVPQQNYNSTVLTNLLLYGNVDMQYQEKHLNKQNNNKNFSKDDVVDLNLDGEEIETKRKVLMEIKKKKIPKVQHQTDKLPEKKVKIDAYVGSIDKLAGEFRDVIRERSKFKQLFTRDHGIQWKQNTYTVKKNQ